MAISMGQAWEDMLKMARSHREALVAVVGAFTFLPSLAYQLFVPKPVIAPGGSNAAQVMGAFLATWWPAFVALVLITLFGGLAIVSIVMDRRASTVGRMLTGAGRLLLPAVGFWLLTGALAMVVTLICAAIAGAIVMLMFGNAAVGAIFLLPAMLPAVYLMGRTMPGIPLIVAGDEANPLRAFTKTMRLSRRNGWMIAAMFVIIFVVYLIFTGALTSVIGVLMAFIAPKLGFFVENAIVALLSSLMSALTYLLGVAVYNQLNATQPKAAGS